MLVWWGQFHIVTAGACRATGLQELGRKYRRLGQSSELEESTWPGSSENVSGEERQKQIVTLTVWHHTAGLSSHFSTSSFKGFLQQDSTTNQVVNELSSFSAVHYEISLKRGNTQHYSQLLSFLVMLIESLTWILILTVDLTPYLNPKEPPCRCWDLCNVCFSSLTFLYFGIFWFP